MLEMIINCIFVPTYFLGFYFWLDILSNLSILLDVIWISDLIF